MKNIFIAALLWLWCALPVVAQTIKGSVKSTQGEGVGYAHITFLNNTFGGYADASGEFEIKVPAGTYQVAVSAVGYAKLVKEADVEAGQTVQLDFTLQTSVNALDEVVVTGQKRDERLVDAPLAITAISSKKIEETRTWELSGLQALVPNYNYGQVGVGFQQVQTIRGIQVFSENPAIATYIDGVNQLDILSNGFQLVDIERVEVLRGPQGTLFGRNAMGGVVNITTKQPTNKTEGFVEATVGNLGFNRHAFGIKTPVVEDKLFFGFSGLYRYRDGFWENDTTGTHEPDPATQGARVGDESSFYGNAYLRWIASDKFDATLNVKGQIDDSDASSFFVYQLDDEVARSSPGQVNLGRIGTHRRDVLNTALSLNYNAPGFRLSSTTAYQQVGLSFADIYEAVRNPQTGVGGTIYNSFEGGELGERLGPQEVWSQEFKIVSNNPKKRLSYVGGAYFFNQQAAEPTTNIAIDYGTFNGPLILGEFYTPGVNVVFRNRAENYGLAAFGQADYKLTDQLTATLGLRYDYESRENTFNASGEVLFLDGVTTEVRSDTTLSADFEALSPKVALAYRFIDGGQIYASYTRGFRAGGINLQRVSGQDLSFDPETSNNFELGYKVQPWEDKLYLALTAYYINWNDMQFFTQDAANIFKIDNVGDAESMGVEAEVSAILAKGLRFGLAYGYNDSEYGGFSLPSFFEGSIELGGNRLSNTPTSTLYTSLQYEKQFDSGLGITARLGWRRVGQMYADRENSLEIGPYFVLNGDIGVSYGKTKLSFWSNNFTDERYIAYASPSTANGNRTALSSAPRLFGITLSSGFSSGR